ncbi:MAG: enoyl-CoA hydratase [Deltaproteobacteria bacterium]|nr:MAG: enoyl-CoA hydratase [Deltaproteobacteria bacterium]
MSYETIILAKEEGIAKITLNRPDRLNAISIQMAEELVDVIEDCGRDDDVRAVVINGAGRAFCSGADLKSDTSTGSPQERIGKMTEILHRLVLEIRNLKKPVIASIRGHASGAGYSLVMACDLAIASENAKFNLAFVKIGLVPDLGATYFLPRLAGAKKSSEYFFTGDIIDVKEAEKIYVVNKVVPDEDLEKETQELAARLAKGPTLAIGRTKELINEGFVNTLKSQLDDERQFQILSAGTEDYTEGVEAFLEKREPKFKGR